MTTKTRTRILWTLGAFLFILTAPFAAAQARDEYGEVHQTVARISFLAGEVSFSRGDDPDDWQPADRNVPMTLGDRIYTGSRSRLELQLQGGDFVRLGARSDFAALNLTDDTKQFSLRSGVASIQVRRLSDNEIFEIDTPNAAVTFDRQGDYRVDVDEDGSTRVSVRRGSATVAAGGGQVPLEAGEAIDVEGLDSPRYDIVRLSSPDAWDQWVSQRDGRRTRARSYQYVNADIVGADDLDEYGRWENAPDYGWVWSPTSVAADWAPYRTGHWIWQDPWGWTWVSNEPWGWAPYHYGRWARISSRWCWVPEGPSARAVSYSPALVAFVGGGSGWSASVTVGGGGFVGWFPLGPRDPFSPWWGSRARVGYSSVGSNVAYVNRTHMTVVNRNTFVSGGVVTGNIVRDRTVISQVGSAPVLRGPIPVVPTRGSLHGRGESRDAAAAPRPPAAIVSRMVVARTAPPPAPPTFQSKLAVITENRGAPVEPAAAARISVENRGRGRAVTEVRAVAPESGRVTLSPRDSAPGAAGTRRVEPVTAVRGRPMATSEQPVSARPVTGQPAPPSAPAAPERQVVPRQPVPAAEPAPQAPPDRGRERRVAPVHPLEPQPEEVRGRARPTEVPAAPAPPAAPIERRRALPPENPAQPAPNVERQREQPASPPQQPPPAGIERRRERPADQPAPPEQPPPAERRREPPAAQPAPPQQPPAQPGVQRGRPAPDSPPAREARPEKGRDAAPPPPPQQQPPEAAPPTEARPQPQRGRPTTPKPDDKEQKDKDDKEQKDKKDERGRKPN